METRKALLMVDVQNDFCPGGGLAVPGGDTVVPVLNRYIELFSKKGLPVFSSRDWHPSETGHFRRYGGRWPRHCVRGTAGARFHPDLRLPGGAVVLSKGMDPGEDGYSAFQGEDSEGRSLSVLLEEMAVGEVCVGGLATEHCVKHTVLDALEKGIAVTVLTDAIRGVSEEEAERARREMKDAGARESTYGDVERRLSG